MKVVISARARQDMTGIGREIAKDNPARALSFLDELELACLGLASMPQAFEVIGRHRGSDVRRRTHGNYLIIYEVRQDRVDIMRVFHGSRNYRRILFRKD